MQLGGFSEVIGSCKEEVFRGVERVGLGQARWGGAVGAIGEDVKLKRPGTKVHTVLNTSS